MSFPLNDDDLSGILSIVSEADEFLKREHCDKADLSLAICEREQNIIFLVRSVCDCGHCKKATCDATEDIATLLETNTGEKGTTFTPDDIEKAPKH